MVEGGKPDGVYPFTGISADLYKYSAINATTAWHKLTEIIGPEGSVIGCYNADFVRPLIERLALKVNKNQPYNFIDIMLLIRCLKNKNIINYQPLQSIKELEAWLIRRPYSRTLKYSLDSVCENLGIPKPADEIFKAKAKCKMLLALYQKLLNMSVI
jgi:DNA polymerase III epsilon subunit-like protein